MTPQDQRVIDSQAVVIDVYKSFRSELLGAFGNTTYTRKSNNTPVTVYDLKVEEALRSRLAEAFPDFGFEGEETGAVGNRETYWLVDPIDGTSSFIRGLPFSTNMAALVHDGVVIAAVIYDFVNDVLYTARKGHGAYKNGQLLRLNTTRQAGDLLVYVMSPKSFGHIREALSELRIRSVLPLSAAGHDYAMLAEGKIDGIVIIERGKGLHDNAPGVLLCEEAGAVLLPYDDEQGVYRSQFVIGSPAVVDPIEHSGLL